MTSQSSGNDSFQKATDLAQAIIDALHICEAAEILTVS